MNKITTTTLLFLSLLNVTATVLAESINKTSSISSSSYNLGLKEFIEQATQNDTTFETILIDQLALQYRRDILLPDSDIIMDIKYQHNFYLNPDKNEPESTLSLSKLFPYNGTKVSLTYNKKSSKLINNEDSSLELLISQSIAKNAFGKGVELQDKIIGIENDISRYQITEAYEDYLASVTTAYYNWYSAYENLKVSKSSYQSNKKLLENILERQRQKIALPIDVNKMKLLLIGKKESLIILQENYDSLSNLIYKAIRHTKAIPYIPVKPKRPTQEVHFESDYNDFTDNSRTYKMLRLLEDQGTFEVKKSADDLLPSTNLLLGYKVDGQDWGIRDQERSYFAGISMQWPINRSVNKAKQHLSKIEHKKTVLSNQNKYQDLRTNLKNLYLQIQREDKLIRIAKKKIFLSEKILKDETENYSFGKVSLNDYISSVNRVDENKFNYTSHKVQLNKLLVEWLRLTDRLVSKNILNTSPIR